MSHEPPLCATYRLQFREGVDFAVATGIVPYLARLGISHLYASPIFKALRGSTHGYDVADPREIEPALGGREGFIRLCEALKAHGMGLLLDIVPNHVGVGLENPWWSDLLTHGPRSRGARFFDIDWQARAGGTPNKVLLPFLGEPLGEAVEQGRIEIRAEGEPRQLFAAYFDNCFPLDPESWAIALAGRDIETIDGPLDLDRAALERLLAAQHWRLSWWRSGDALLNWRRFFDVTELAGVRIEDHEVMAETHRLIGDLIAKDQVQGLRIDHIDGLADPAGYLERLAQQGREASPRDRRPWLLVEKILGPGEDLNAGWEVDGTTGYELLNRLMGLFVDPAGEEALNALYRRFGGDPEAFGTIVQRSKTEILENNLRAEVERLTSRLMDHAAGEPSPRDLPPVAVRSALIALIAAFDVYRTYGATGSYSKGDRGRLESAFKAAADGLDTLDRAGLAFLEDVLLQRGPGDERCRPLVRAFEQLTGPAMAKALEDTAFYRWFRLTALNEVGGEPDHFGTTPAALHDVLQMRAERWPQALVSTASHDTKRGEDTRLRIVALASHAEAWASEVGAWHEMLGGESLGDPVVSYLFYQTLVGTVPFDRTSLDWAALRARMTAYLEKALREGKERTNWLDPNEPFEAAVKDFVERALNPEHSAGFHERLFAFLDSIEPEAALHALAQKLLALTIPGVPDVYRGSESWDQSLVDPDNRRPVAFDHLATQLDDDASFASLLDHWRDGAVKQRLIARTLACRRAHSALFTHGRYRPLVLQGDNADRFFAFAREDDDASAIVIVPRLVGPLLTSHDQLTINPGALSVVLPASLERADYEEVLSGQSVGSLDVTQLLQAQPLLLLIRSSAQDSPQG